MRWFHTVILLAVPVLAVGCLPTTPAEAGVGVVMLGFACLLPGLGLISQWFKVEEGKKKGSRVLPRGVFPDRWRPHCAGGPVGRLVGPVSPRM